ncbi:MAG: hypothetical protein ACE3JK_08415 [Sporolactobacillus sp.]
MHKVYTRLGEHLFEVTADSATLMNRYAHRFTSDGVQSNASADMTVHLHGSFAALPTLSEFIISESASKSPFSRDSFHFDISADLSTANLYLSDTSVLQEAFMTLYGSILLMRGWGLLIRASSCLDSAERSHLLFDRASEEPGASPEAYLTLKIDSAGVRVFHWDTQNGRAQLDAAAHPAASINLVRHAFLNRRLRTGRTRGLLRLLDRVSFWPHQTEETKRVLTLLQKLVHLVPVFDCDLRQSSRPEELIS